MAWLSITLPFILRDTALYLHVLAGLLLIALPALILVYLKKESQLLRPAAIATAAISWIMLIPAGRLYLTFYPATKTLINAGSWPWAHAVIMETKEHWGILLPIVTTVATAYLLAGKKEESRKWWILAIILTVLIGVMGRLIKMGALK